MKIVIILAAFCGFASVALAAVCVCEHRDVASWSVDLTEIPADAAAGGVGVYDWSTDPVLGDDRRAS